jgi:hypothetical protein
MADVTEKAGGIGGSSLTIDINKPSDRLLIIAAIKGRWPTPQATRRKLIDAMLTLIETGSAKHVIGCANVLVAADRMNQADELRELKARRAVRRSRSSSKRRVAVGIPKNT